MQYILGQIQQNLEYEKVDKFMPGLTVEQYSFHPNHKLLPDTKRRASSELLCNNFSDAILIIKFSSHPSPKKHKAVHIIFFKKKITTKLSIGILK